MNRLLKTTGLTFVIFLGAWLLFNRHQIHSFSDAISLAQYQLNGDSNFRGPSFGDSNFRGSNFGDSNFDNNSQPFGLINSSDYRPTQTPHYLAPLSEAPRPPQQQSLPFQRTVARVPDSGPALRTPNSINPGTIRIASFKLDSRSDTGGNIRRTTDICQEFDVVALQNSSQLSISKLVNDLNRRGYDFRFVDRSGNDQRFATIFNQQTVVLEDQHWYTVNDPEDLFLFEPLVAWFRARDAHPQEAFTFSLANVQLNDRKPDAELSHLGELFRAIRLDGRGEDDIILAGDFFSNDKQLKKLKTQSGLSAAIVGLATNTRNDMQLDNILIEKQATVEFSGESGVFDFMKRFNMTLNEALSISNRMPVWAEFSNFEGRAPGRAVDRNQINIGR